MRLKFITTGSGSDQDHYSHCNPLHWPVVGAKSYSFPQNRVQRQSLSTVDGKSSVTFGDFIFFSSEANMQEF